MRPLVLTTVCNVDCPEPQFTLKRDVFLDEYAQDVVLDASKLPDALAERNVETDVPIYLTCEWKFTWNMVVYDTPGWLEPTDEYPDVDREALLNSIVNLVKVPERIVVLVEETNIEAPPLIPEFLRQADPGNPSEDISRKRRKKEEGRRKNEGQRAKEEVAERQKKDGEEKKKEGRRKRGRRRLGRTEKRRRPDRTFAAMERTLFVRSKLDKALEVVAQAGGAMALNQHLSEAPRLQVRHFVRMEGG